MARRILLPCQWPRLLPEVLGVSVIAKAALHLLTIQSVGDDFVARNYTLSR